MTTESVDLKELHETYVKMFDSSFSKLRAATDSGKLEEIRDKLQPFAERVCRVKRAANKQRNEFISNEMLGKEAALRSLIHLSSMWIQIKSNKPHDGWNEYAEAENWGQLAARFLENPNLLEFFRDYFISIETVIFPNMIYFSPGFTRTLGKCTICDLKFGECKHIRGRIYFGQVCDEYGYKMIEGDHVAMVDVPRDKKCYARAYKSEGNWFDRMTWANIEKPAKEGEEKGFLIEGTILTMHTPAGAFL